MPSAPRYFECVDSKSNKFWEISQSGNEFTTRWGRIGSEGQTKTKPLADEAAATLQVQKLIASKVGEGYVEKAPPPEATTDSGKLNDVIARLRALNEPVPIPMRLPTEQEVAAAESDLGFVFHPDFRAYLLRASDVVFGALEPVTLTVPDSHTAMRQVAADAWDAMEVPRKLLPICEDNGDYYCMNSKGQVVFWSADGASDEKWPDLATWIEQVWIEESR